MRTETLDSQKVQPPNPPETPLDDPFSSSDAEVQRIEIGIPTRNRPACLAMVLQALRTQTYQNWDLTLVDDNDDPLIPQQLIIQKLLWLLDMDGHRCRVIRGHIRGPHFAHNVVLASTDRPLILRLDDDLVPEANFLEVLYGTFIQYASQRPTGAVAGVYPSLRSSRLEDHLLTDAVQATFSQYGPWESIQQRFIHPHPASRQVSALYSSFLYERQALLQTGGFPLAYSRLAEKEETDTTLRLVIKGYSVIIEPSAVAWHFEAPSGGGRMTPAEKQPLFEADIALFQKRLQSLTKNSFDWQAEYERNLSPVQSFSQLMEMPTGFYGY